MPKRTVKLVSAIFTGILAGACLATPSRGETAPPDSCLTSPKGDAPAGAHWYYRIERGTKRHCWYVREQGEKQSQASPQNILPPARTPAPVATPAPQHSPVDARAELALQSSRDEAPTAPAPAAAAPTSDDAQPDAPAADASPPSLASRWPDPLATIPQISAQPANSNLAASTSSADQSVSPEPVDAAVIPADAESASPGERGIMPLVVAILGTLALAAVILVRFAQPQRRRPRTVRAHRGPIWETTDDDRIVLSDQQPMPNPYMRRPRFARSFSEIDERKTETRKTETHRQKPRRARA